MEADNQNFCTRCGHLLSDSARFCPECGARVPGRNPEQVEEEKQAIRSAMDRQLRWAAILMLIYSIPFLVIGVYTVFNVDAMADLVVNDPNFSSYAEAYGLTYDEVCEYFEYAGYAFILSSVLGLISALCCWKRSHFWVALVFCVLSVFTGAAGFVAMFMGLIALWMIIVARGRFVEYEKNFEEILSKIE